MKGFDSGVTTGSSLPGPSCVCYLPIVEGSGTPHDFSKHGNDATLTGGTWVTDPSVPSALGYGIKLDGVDDVLKIPDDASLDTSGPLTIRMRFKTPTWGNGANEVYLTKTESGNVAGWRIRKNSSEKLVAPAANVNPVGDLDPDIVYELVISTNSSKSWTFINGGLVFDLKGNTVGTSSNPVRIGAQWDESSFTEMTVYSVEIYDRLLGIDELNGRFDSGWSQFGGVEGQTRWFDDSWIKQMEVDPANNEIILSDSGARLFVNGSGEIVAEDEAGNTTTLS